MGEKKDDEMIYPNRIRGDSSEPTHLPYWNVSRPLVTTGLFRVTHAAKALGHKGDNAWHILAFPPHLRVPGN